MLMQTHRTYHSAFRGSDWLARVNLIYLAVMPAFVLAALVYLIWLYITV